MQNLQGIYNCVVKLNQVLGFVFKKQTQSRIACFKFVLVLSLTTSVSSAIFILSVLLIQPQHIKQGRLEKIQSRVVIAEFCLLPSWRG